MEKIEIEEKIVAMLKTVYDPEIPVNVYDLGLIYKIDVSDSGEAAHHSQTASTGSLTAVCLHNPRPPPPQTAHERSLSCVTFRKN